MEQRLNIHTIEPNALKGIFAIENYLNESNVSKSYIHLIKIRASQINSCAFCINMHTREALKAGETQQRLFLLDVWKDSGLFTDVEQVLLQLTEEITLIHQEGLSDNTYTNIRKFFTENQIAQIIMVVIAINAWNRIAVSTHMQLD